MTPAQRCVTDGLVPSCGVRRCPGRMRYDLRGLSDCTLKKVWSPMVATW
jgi:hypothetical protein